MVVGRLGIVVFELRDEYSFDENVVAVEANALVVVIDPFAHFSPRDPVVAGRHIARNAY